MPDALWPVLNFLSPLVSWAGLGTTITGAALAAAIYLPAFRRLALEVAIVAGVGTALFWWGDQTGSKRVKAQWDAAESRSVEKGNDARTRAESDVDRAGAGRLPDDRYDRDNH